VTSPRLEARRSSNEPKCANCKHWSERDSETATVGQCERRNKWAPEVSPGTTYLTLDLSVCSAWELHEVLFGRVMKPSEIIDET
jgi:hypothetical protein